MDNLPRRRASSAEPTVSIGKAASTISPEVFAALAAQFAPEIQAKLAESEARVALLESDLRKTNAAKAKVTALLREGRRMLRSVRYDNKHESWRKREQLRAARGAKVLAILAGRVAKDAEVAARIGGVGPPGELDYDPETFYGLLVAHGDGLRCLEADEAEAEGRKMPDPPSPSASYWAHQYRDPTGLTGGPVGPPSPYGSPSLIDRGSTTPPPPDEDETQPIDHTAAHESWLDRAQVVLGDD
jgi:hypothetical protein